MKIHPSAFNIGKPARKPELDSAARLQGSVTPSLRGENNTDKISISSQGARQADTTQLARAATAELQRPASPQRLATLQQQVRDGSYRIPTGDLVQALMQRWMGV